MYCGWWECFNTRAEGYSFHCFSEDCPHTQAGVRAYAYSLVTKQMSADFLLQQVYSFWHLNEWVRKGGFPVIKAVAGETPIPASHHPFKITVPHKYI